MLCPKCNNQMTLRHVSPPDERYIYECEQCAIILSPLLQVIKEPDIYIEKIKKEIEEKNEC